MTRVAVFGEMLVDQFPSGPVVGGAPFNVARHLAAFGHAPLMLGAVGRDAPGELVMAEFDRYGMRRGGVQLAQSAPTGVVEVRMGADGGHEFLIRDGCAWDSIQAEPARAALSQLDGEGWLYAGTLALRSPVSRETGLGLLRAHRGAKYVDLNWRDGHVRREVALEAVRLADVLKVNDEELAMLCGWLGGPPAAAPDAAAAHVLSCIPLQLLVVTCGPAGALAFDRAGTRTACAAAGRTLQLRDTVGAGDAFSAVMLAGLLRGWDLPLTLARANAFAGHICEVRGAVPPELACYAEWTAGWATPPR